MNLETTTQTQDEPILARKPIHELSPKEQAKALGFLSLDLLPSNIEKHHPWISETPRCKFATRSALGELVSRRLIEAGHQSAFDEGVRQAREQIEAWSREAVRQLLM